VQCSPPFWYLGAVGRSVFANTQFSCHAGTSAAGKILH
jgi:hypothetical protein